MSWDFECHVTGVPRPKGSKRYVGHRMNKRLGKKLPMLVESSGQNLKDWRDKLRSEFEVVTYERQLAQPIIGPIAYRFLFEFPYQKGDRWHICRPDISKLIRAVEDELVQAGVISDDSLLCCDLGSVKIRCLKGNEPGVYVWLRAATEDDLKAAIIFR